jgi:hypothetical protein
VAFYRWETLPDYPRGRFSAPEPLGQIEREYEAKVYLYSDSKLDGPAGAYDYVVANVVAGLNSTYQFFFDFDNSAYLYSIDPQRVKGSENPWLWIVTLHWKTFKKDDQKEDKDKNGEKTDDPTKWKPEVKTGSIKEEEVVDDATYLEGYGPVAEGLLTDRGDGPVVNSALHPFDPPPTRRRSLTTYTFVTYTNSILSDLQLRDSVNDDLIQFSTRDEDFSFPAYTAYLDDVTTKPSS